jgi:hypothetical protein
VDVHRAAASHRRLAHPSPRGATGRAGVGDAVGHVQPEPVERHRGGDRGADRIIHFEDFPYVIRDDVAEFLEQASLFGSPAKRHRAPQRGVGASDLSRQHATPIRPHWRAPAGGRWRRPGAFPGGSRAAGPTDGAAEYVPLVTLPLPSGRWEPHKARPFATPDSEKRRPQSRANQGLGSIVSLCQRWIVAIFC